MSKQNKNKYNQRSLPLRLRTLNHLFINLAYLVSQSNWFVYNCINKEVIQWDLYRVSAYTETKKFNEILSLLLTKLYIGEI